MSGPTKRTPARKRSAPRAPHKATEAEVDQAQEQQSRVEAMISMDEASAIDELTVEIGRLHKQNVIDRAIIRRLVNHILMIDPDDQIAKKIVADARSKSGLPKEE